MTERSEVYAALDSERDYQDDKLSVERVGREATDRSLDEFILYIQQYAAEAGALTTHEDEDEALNFVRKVGALCVGCMEKHGAPQREGYEREWSTKNEAEAKALALHDYLAGSVNYKEYPTRARYVNEWWEERYLPIILERESDEV